LDRVATRELVDGISAVAAKVKPDVVYTVGPSDVHSDHRVLFDGVESALKSFRSGDQLRKILVYETLSSTDVRISPAASFRPTTFVDIGATIDRKIEIMGLYASELQASPLPRNAETLRALARVRGAAAGVGYAEAFQLMREVVRPGARL
jgi:LmbE family N-acetylglucosaminyl deacetylase